MLYDYSPQPTPPLALPTAGQTYVDPVFGSTIARVTDENHGLKCSHYYSWSSVWDAAEKTETESKMLIFVDDGDGDVPYIYGFNHETMSSTRLYALSSVHGCPKIGSSASLQWDRRQPGILYALEATPSGGYQKQRIVRFNLNRNQCGEYKRFNVELPNCELDQLDISDSGNVFSFQAKDQTKDANGVVIGPITACVWDRFANVLFKFPAQPGATPIHAVSLSRCGQWAMVAMSYPKAGETGHADLYFWRWADGKIIKVEERDGTSFGIINHTMMGRTGLISGCASNSGISFRRYEDFASVDNLFRFSKADGSINWDASNHVSLRGPLEGSVIVSTYVHKSDGAPSYENPFVQEIFEIDLLTKKFRRLADTRSVGPNFVGPNYGRQPRVSCSPSGRFAAYTSDLGSPTRTDVMVLRLPPPWKEVELGEQVVGLLHVIDSSENEIARLRSQVDELEDHGIELEGLLTNARAVIDKVRADVS